MVLDQLFVYTLVLLLLPSDAYGEADTYDIPITFNPLIQNCVKKSLNTEIFYNFDKPFYSKVTVIDAAKNTEKHVKNVIKKTIGVVFLTVASSHVSGSLPLSALKYTEPSKWSYTLKVQSILNASNGKIPELTDGVVLYKIQESAMKVLEKRYGFSVSDILVKLSLTTMEFYGVDEDQWIDVVGIITEKVITNKTEKLNLTSCYLAEMVNKTVAEINAFTLNEVDMYIYNTNLLVEKLPGYRNTVISSLYQTFNITAPQLASISNIDISIINTMQLKDIIQVFTTSILKELHVSKAEIIQSDPIFQPEMILSCTDKWEPFKRLAISKSFDNAAKSMSITNQTLASLLEISYTDVNMFTVNEMINILATLIQPLKEDKIMVESSKLHEVVASHSSETLNSTKDNAFAAIEMFTNFTTRQLTLLYGWKEKDYQFAKMFSLDDINKTCFLDPNDYSLFILATINVGDVHSSCKSFNVFREIWQRKSIKDLETKFSKVLPFDQPISSAITLLTNAPLAISYRPLNITTEEQEIVQKITFNNISTVTTYSDSILKKMSFQEVIELAVHLYQNGSFNRTVKVVSFSVVTSSTPSLSLIPTNSNIPSKTYPSETTSHSKSLLTYQNQMTQFTTKSTQLYSANLSTTLISTFTVNYIPMINVSSHSYSTKMMNKQSSVTKNISQATSVGVQLSYTPGTTLTLSSSYILRSGAKTRSSSIDDISSSKMNIINTQIRSSPVPSTFTLPLDHISVFSSSRNFATNASESQSQSSETNSATFLHSKRFTASNSNQTLSSVTPTTVTFHNVSLSTSHSKTGSQLTSYHSTTSPLVTTMPRPYSTNIMKSSSLTPSLFPLKTTMTNMTLTYAQTHTTLITNWTNAMTNTTTIISSPTDSTIAFSNGETDLSTTVSPNSSSPTTISLVIQTTDEQSTISSSIRSSTSIVPTPTSTMSTTKHNFIGSQVSSTIETTTGISKTSSETPSHIFTTVSALYQNPTSAYLPKNTVSTSRMSSLQIYQSPTSKTMNATASIEPSTTKHQTMTSSVTKPTVDACQSTTACKDDQACVTVSGQYKCEAAQNLHASFKITKGLTYSPDLLNKKSDAFLNFSRQMEYLIDSVYKKTIYSSNYFGCKVTEFKKGSVIVLYKLRFKNNWRISNSTMQNITNAFKDEVGNIVGNSTVITDISSVQDFDECSSDKTNDCYKTANCNNTIGSYKCFCPSGTTDDGKTCKANSPPRDNDDDVPWIIYVVIAIMVALIIFLIVVLIYCEKKHKKRNRSHLDLYNNGINMYPRSTSYLAETPESEADLADGLGIVNRRGPQPNMVTFNPSPDEKKELETQNGQPGMLLSFKQIDPD